MDTKHQSLTLETRTCDPGIVAIALGGHLTLGRERGQIEAAVLKALEEGIRRFVFDLSAVTYIDSTGIGIVAYCFGKIARQSGHAAVAGASGLVKEIFRLTRLDNVIPFYPDVPSACEALVTSASA